MATRFFGDIVSPCAVSFDSLEGEGNVRYCGQCKLNVHNFTEMTADEVSAIIQNRNGRLCASIRKRPDGSIYTDNCPYKLRRARNVLRRYAPWTLLILAALFNQTAADAQGLVGAPVDPRFGQSGNLAALPDYGYDTARDMLKTATITSALLMPFIAVMRVKDSRAIAFWQSRSGVCLATTKQFVRRRMWLCLWLLLVPLGIHFGGIILINNFSVLGGGL